MPRVLVVDDSIETCDLLELLIQRIPTTQKIKVFKASRPEDAIALLEKEHFDLMLSDINLESDKDGLDLLRIAKPRGVETILLSGFGTVEKAMEAVREGAFDFVSKPWSNEELISLIQRTLLRRENTISDKNARPRAPQSAMIGSSPQMIEVYKTIASLQDSKSTVLIVGESGTGKELVARTIYQSSNRKDMPFIAVNCGSITETLLESELFGHVKGAFTGAINDKKGLFEEAHGGTIFLDEVAEISPSFQVRLLRVLQEGEVKKVGSNKIVYVDVRVIAATNKDLLQLVKEEKFREDLYYRLSVVELKVPPVRMRNSWDERTKKYESDISLLIEFFLEGTKNKGVPQYQISSDAMEQLIKYNWPGNVREIANVIEHITQLCRGREITLDDLPEKIKNTSMEGNLPNTTILPLLAELVDGWECLPTLEELERRYIQILLKNEPRKGKVAEILGKDRTTLYRKLRDLGLLETKEE